jgi:hypothetical protein
MKDKGKRLDGEGKRSRMAYRLENWPGGLTVSPDGRWILYTQLDQRAVILCWWRTFIEGQRGTGLSVGRQAKRERAEGKNACLYQVRSRSHNSIALRHAVADARGLLTWRRVSVL